MNSDQKKRIAHELSNWANVKKYCSYTVLRFTGNRMAALLQELVDAPEAEPVANVKTIGGYPDDSVHVAEWLVPYKQLCEGDKLYLAPPPPAPSAPEPKSCGWIRAIDEAMVTHHLGVADIADDYEAAKKKLNTLLSLNQNIGEYFSAKAPAPSVPDGWIRAVDEAMVVHHIGIADRADSYEVAKKKLNALLAINSDIARDCSEPPADVARDAERYRWLRHSNWYIGEESFYCTEGGQLEDCKNENCSAESLDAAIDAARKRQGGE